MLWDNLIDFDKQYSFETELEVCIIYNSLRASDFMLCLLNLSCYCFFLYVNKTPMYRKKQMTAIRDKVRSQDSRESSPADSPPCAYG